MIAIDHNQEALELAKAVGADETALADGSQVDAVREVAGGTGAAVVFDFVAEGEAQNDAWAMTAAHGSLFVVGYGGELRIPTVELITAEKNVIGNMVGTYTDLVELMVLAQSGRVTQHARRYPLAQAPQVLDELSANRIRGRAILVP